MMAKNTVGRVHEILEDVVRPGMQVVDATLGRGNDALKLAQCLQGQGTLYGFDVQEEALKETWNALKDFPNLEKKLYLIGHEHMQEMVTAPVNVIVFNLGYLPRGDKNKTTMVSSTLAAVKQSLNLLKENGTLLVTCYPGHAEGKREEEALLEFFTQCPQKEMTIVREEFVNQVHCPPLLYRVEVHSCASLS